MTSRECSDVVIHVIIPTGTGSMYKYNDNI